MRAGGPEGGGRVPRRLSQALRPAAPAHSPAGSVRVPPPQTHLCPGPTPPQPSAPAADSPAPSAAQRSPTAAERTRSQDSGRPRQEAWPRQRQRGTWGGGGTASASDLGCHLGCHRGGEGSAWGRAQQLGREEGGTCDTVQRDGGRGNGLSYGQRGQTDSYAGWRQPWRAKRAEEAAGACPGSEAWGLREGTLILSGPGHPTEKEGGGRAPSQRRGRAYGGTGGKQGSEEGCGLPSR